MINELASFFLSIAAIISPFVLTSIVSELGRINESLKKIAEKETEE